jgi:hypothetical protein
MLAIARSISTLIFCSLFAVTAANAAQDDWLTYRHDNARTGAQPIASDLSDPARISGLHVVAQFPWEGSPAIAGGFKASPIVVDGIAYIGGVNGYFYALDAASGALIWQYLKPGTRPCKVRAKETILPAAMGPTVFKPARHSRSLGVKMRLFSERLIPPRIPDWAAPDFLRSRSPPILTTLSRFGKAMSSHM